MITTRGLECSANLMRGRLKHSWLENQILNKSAEDVIFLFRNSGWRALERVFLARVDETITLAADLENGFSPQVLVDKLEPFKRADESVRVQIKSAVHARYMEVSRIQEMKTPCQEAASSLGSAITKLLEIWQYPIGEENEEALRSVWEEVAVRARDLHSILEKLPKGLVLP